VIEKPHLDLGEITSSRIAKIEAVVEQQLQATASASAASKPAPAPISTPTNLTDIDNASDVDNDHSSSLVSQTNPTLDAVSDSQVDSSTIVTPVNEEETN